MSAPRPIELLAPAGNVETALAALDAGADAVYCGLGRFNARARAENFTPDTMAGVIELFHRQGKKVYLTLNTLIYESELPRLVETLGVISRLQPDALIVQDLGVAGIVKKYFPNLTLHASTQMGIHNSAGVEFAAKLGFSRVILERQIPLDELRTIAAKSPVELEVFIHGSLCCSLSGRCLLSHHLFGAGGNRGVCKQPCRRAYDGEYRLSPADLCGVAFLPELRKMGIASLKIEGRLRPPEYVWKCTRAYRMLLDAPEPDEKTLLDAQTLLASASGRANDSGFFDRKRYDKLIDVRRPGVFGIAVGNVISARRGNITVRLQNKLHLGDRLRLVPPEGGEGETFSLISMRDASGNLLRARSGATVEIATDCRAGKNFLLLKIGENGFDFTRRLKNLPPRREKIDLQIEISAHKWRISSPRFDGQWAKCVDFAEAQRHELTAETVREVFFSGAPETLSPGKITVSVDGKLFVPASVIKAIRREFWADISGKLLPEADPGALAAARFAADHSIFRPASARAIPETIDTRFYGFLPEGNVEMERSRFAAALKDDKVIAVEGLHALNWLPHKKGKIVTRFPVAVANSFAAQLLAEQGVVAVEAAPELPARERAMLAAKSPVPLLPFRAVPLLVSRLPLAPGVWHDAVHHGFEVGVNEEKLSVLLAKSEVLQDDDAVNEPPHDRQ
ncbi:MAG: DUF3656 domain-containing protein [Victivallaceae bacterium]|nr:DUF3656 domain-containing protein [Victivallaceae bacterium]